MEKQTPEITELENHIASLDAMNDAESYYWNLSHTPIKRWN
jgi:hypothetical protein